MKRFLSAVLALCLIVTLQLTLAVPAQAASGSEKSLQIVQYYDAASKAMLEDYSTGVLMKAGEYNFVITNLSSKEDDDIYTTFTTETEKTYLCFFAYAFNEQLNFYVTEDTYGEAEGFIPGGLVTEGETVYLVMPWDEDGARSVVSTTATALKGDVITLNQVSGTEVPYPLPVLNSKQEVCGVYYGKECYSIATDEEIFYGGGTPAGTEPPATQPPADGDSADKPLENEELEDLKRPVDLPELDTLYAEALIQKQSSKTGTIAIVGIAVLIVILLAAVVIVRRKNKQKADLNLDEAEEGTELEEEPVDTGLRLQFRNGKRIAVRRSFTIGRAPDNDVVIPKNATSVSGRHCEIVVQNGMAYLRDLGSTNGTFINGRRVPVGQLVQLQPGIVVCLGSANSTEAFNVVLSSGQM